MVCETSPPNEPANFELFSRQCGCRFWFRNMPLGFGFAGPAKDYQWSRRGALLGCEFESPTYDKNLLTLSRELLEKVRASGLNSRLAICCIEFGI